MRVRNDLGNRYRGRMGTSTIASSWKGRDYFKTYTIPRDPRTQRQLEMRERFGGVKILWRQLTDEQRAEYDRRASEEGMSGWNLFVRESTRRPKLAARPRAPPSLAVSPPANGPRFTPTREHPMKIRDLLALQRRGTRSEAPPDVGAKESRPLGGGEQGETREKKEVRGGAVPDAASGRSNDPRA